MISHASNFTEQTIVGQPISWTRSQEIEGPHFWPARPPGRPFNSLSPERCKSKIFKLISKIDILSISSEITWVNVAAPHCWLVNIGSGNGLLLVGNNPLFEPMLTYMSSYGYCTSHCGDKMILQPCYLHEVISHTGMTSSPFRCWNWCIPEQGQ